MGFEIIKMKDEKQLRKKFIEYVETCPNCGKERCDGYPMGHDWGLFKGYSSWYRHKCYKCGTQWNIEKEMVKKMKGVIKRIVKTPERYFYEQEQIKKGLKCPHCQHHANHEGFNTDYYFDDETKYHNTHIIGIKQTCYKCDTTYRYNFE